MENKKTTELIDLLHSLIDKEGRQKEGYEEALEELKSREPFWTLLDDDYDEGIPAIMGYIRSLEAEVKLLKRHKHDEKTNDVMVRV